MDPRRNSPTQVWLALSGTSRWGKRTVGGLALQTSHSRLLPQGRRLAIGKEVTPLWSYLIQEVVFTTASGWTRPFNYLCLPSHTMCAPILELRFAGKELDGCLCQVSWGKHRGTEEQEETERKRSRGRAVGAGCSACCIFLTRKKLHTISNYCI